MEGEGEQVEGEGEHMEAEAAAVIRAGLTDIVELSRRGIMADVPGRGAARSGIEERLQRALSWQRVCNSRVMALRAKQRLQEFQRK